MLSKSCLIALLSLSAAFMGCSGAPKAKPYTLSFEPSQSVSGMSIQVDVIGVTSVDLNDWQSCSVDKYWEPGNPMRADAVKKTLQISGSKPAILNESDVVWADWIQSRGATHLVIIANLPGQFSPGASDPRRKIIPLDKRAWNLKDGIIRVDVRESRLEFRTSPVLK